MKKIDKLLLKSFLNPFLGTFFVIVFLFFMQFFLVFFDEFAGKGLGLLVYSKLFFYFSLNTTPIAFPLAILLSSLITFGNLGEHFELIALKNTGIGLYRILCPLFLLVLFLTFCAFISNNYVVPKSNVKAYRLLYDIRKKKPAVNIKEGVFYKGIPGYTIKIKNKQKDILKDIIIYGYDKTNINNNITIAQKGKIYTQNQGNYLIMELFNGSNYLLSQDDVYNTLQKQCYTSTFKTNKIIFDLSSLAMQETEDRFFKNNSKMQTIHQLSKTIVAKQNIIDKTIKKNMQKYFCISSTISSNEMLKNISHSLYNSIDFSMQKANKFLLEKSLSSLEKIKSNFHKYQNVYQALNEELITFEIEKQHRWAISICCLIMFLIGAPIGIIIKKGGIGAPIIFAIFFYLLYYVLDIVGKQYAKSELISPTLGVWLPHIILLPIGIFFLLQARKDTYTFHFSFIINCFRNIKNIFYICKIFFK